MIKLKSLLVIILSSILISSVILLTIFGLSLYVGWKEGESVKAHRQRLDLLNAKIYGRYIAVQDIQVKYEKRGIYKGKYILEGVVKNNGYRTLSSLEVSIEFLNASGKIIHAERVLPLKASSLPRKTTIAALSLFTSGKETPILPGGWLRFKHVMSEQKNKDIISPIRDKRYATNPKEWSGKFSYRITKVRF